MSKSATRGVYRANGVEIDCGTGLVRRNGTEIALRHKAHRVLLLLMERRSGPVSKEDLVREIWDGAAITDDTLVNCVQEIRKALGDDARNPQFIRTLPKTGYWFVGPEMADAPEPPPVEADPPPPAAETQALPAQSLPGRSRRRLMSGIVLALGLACVTGWLILRKSATEPAATAPNPIWVEASWLRFDEGSGSRTGDASLPSGPGITIPAGVEWVPGVNGAALRFPGVETASISGSLPAALASGAEDRTVVAWVRVQANRADSTMIYSYGHPKDDETFHSFSLGVHASGKAAAFSNRSSVVGHTVIDDGRWHQVAAVISGEKRQTVQIFVDGREDGSGTLTATARTASPEPRFSLGRAMWGGTPFRGDIDDIRVYARSLAPAELFGIHRCMSGVTDLKDSAGIFFTSVLGMNAVLEPMPAYGETSARFRNGSKDYAGIAFARRVEGAGCPVRGAASVDMGQDLRLEADIRTSGNSSDQLTEAGPFFRSRRSAAGDGIMGGVSAGYWVQLKSSGHVAVRRLNPASTVAFTDTVPAGFDPSKFHRLAVEVKGGSARVWLDGALLEFDQAGRKTTEVELPAAWETSDPKGRNGGAAGFAMGAEANRARAGGQEIRNIRLIKL
jgi:DNA-binding winged helix-turn-helix (wHTH) protein